MLDSKDLRRVKQGNKETLTVINKGDSIIPKYDHQEYFQKLNDESKILATINNEFSVIKNQEKPKDNWYPISTMVLSERNFRSYLIKHRFVDDDLRKRNYPLMYEKRGETV